MCVCVCAHSQMLLRIGLLKAQKGPTEQHPYGFARDRFIWRYAPSQLTWQWPAGIHLGTVAAQPVVRKEEKKERKNE